MFPRQILDPQLRTDSEQQICTATGTWRPCPQKNSLAPDENPCGYHDNTLLLVKRVFTRRSVSPQPSKEGLGAKFNTREVLGENRVSCDPPWLRENPPRCDTLCPRTPGPGPLNKLPENLRQGTAPG